MQRTICSLYFHDLDARRNYRRRESGKKSGFSTTFRLAAPARDKFNLLVVPDMEEDFQFSSEAPRTIMTENTTGEMVAQCLIDEWVGHVAHEQLGGPGVFICKDRDERDPQTNEVFRPATEPSEKELAFYRASQTRWCEMICLEASDFYRTGKSKLITARYHGAAAEWLGKTYPWQIAPEQKFTAECPACGAEVKPGKFICAACGTNYDPAGFEAWKRGTLEAQLKVEQLKNEALKANPNLTQDELDVIAIGGPATPEAPAKKGGRHVYG